ncbi:uncharacterized protein LOC142232258 isoform X2 [Haematobia irritans]|uniref:uncharacterized protein LOC142232258 isoform X2 n=1 Tax=Haematobia irritans TaxID=7368 RepID=UPI003F4F7731
MSGMKLVKTTYKDKKEIVRFNFGVGDDSYRSFVSEVKNTYNIPPNVEVQVLSTGYVLKPEIFGDFVGQYIGNLDFFLEIKDTGPKIITPSPKPLIITPSPEPIKEEHDDYGAQQLMEQRRPCFKMDEVTFANPSNNSYSFPSPMLGQKLPSRDEILTIRDVQELIRLPKLENKHRTRLAKSIIKHMQNIDPNMLLDKNDFIQLATNIVEIFPTELVETYYVPRTANNAAMGKLFDAYNNCRTQLRQAGLIPKKSERSPNDLYDSDSQETFTEANSFMLFTGLPTLQEICQIREIRESLNLPKLENKHRTIIAKSIIARILEPYPERRLGRDDFIQLAKYIVELFPTEIRETYYVPCIKGHLQKGKLYDAYNNRRSRLRAAGLIKRGFRARTEDNSMDNSTASEGDNVEEFDIKELEILKSSKVEAWHEVLTMWEKSFHYRQKQLQDENMQPMEYIAKYNVLLNEKCHELFELDFKMLYPNINDIYQWRNYYQKVINRTKDIRGDWIKDIHQYIDDACNDEESKMSFALMLIPYLLPNRKLRKQEIQQCFATYSNTDPFDDDDDDHQPNVKRIKLENENDAKIYFIGNTKGSISHAYVEIAGLRMKFESPMKAVEVCFQCFMTMNIRYPKTCSYIWIFIQKLIFNVDTKHDLILPKITTLINDLNNE